VGVGRFVRGQERENMKKYLFRFFFLALGIMLVFIILNVIDADAIVAIKMELKRYGGINTWNFAFAAFFVIASYLTGRMSSKLNRMDRA
jgi:hypothetical protein